MYVYILLTKCGLKYGYKIVLLSTHTKYILTRAPVIDNNSNITGMNKELVTVKMTATT